MATPRVTMDPGAVAVFLQEPGVGPVTKALVRAGELVFQAAKARCPVSPKGSIDSQTGQHYPSGYLRSSVYGELVGVGGGMAFHVGARAPYAAFVEFGTKPHTIVPKDPNGVLHFVVNGQDVFTKEVHHPGTRAQPFLMPALDALAGRIVEQA